MRSTARTACLVIAVFCIATGAAGAAPRQIQVFNDSDFAMIALQARPAQAKSWPYDLLGKYSLGVGRSQAVPLPSDRACVYDFLATFDDGHKSQKLAADICKLRMLSFSKR